MYTKFQTDILKHVEEKWKITKSWTTTGWDNFMKLQTEKIHPTVYEISTLQVLVLTATRFDNFLAQEHVHTRQMGMGLHNYRSTKFHRNLNREYPSSSFWDIHSAMSGVDTCTHAQLPSGKTIPLQPDGMRGKKPQLKPFLIHWYLI